jgi:hypothetical protein
MRKGKIETKAEKWRALRSKRVTNINQPVMDLPPVAVDY